MALLPMRRIISLVLLANASLAAIVQQPVIPPPSIPLAETEPDEFQFNWPIRKVAIIGAGPSGMNGYRELTEVGLSVRMFERDTRPGGNWHYTEETPLDAPVPNLPTPIADFMPSFPPEGVSLPYTEEFHDSGDTWIAHRLPKPLWESLTTNVPSLMQQFLHWPLPQGLPWELPHYTVRNYVRSYASYLFINSNDGNEATSYNTRVEHVEKRVNESGQEQGWRLWLKKLEPISPNTYRATWWTEDFDAVVVATGHFNAPWMPNIPGLDYWFQRFPDRLRHSRQYRRPELYANQTVLIVGASVSGSEISRDLNPHAKKIYQSFRPSKDNQVHFRVENFLRRIPQNTSLVGEIKQFLPVPEGFPIKSGLIELMNGTVLSGIDSVIFCTGYRYTYPFLSQYYDSATYAPHEGSAPTVSPFLPVDGSHIRDMYHDMFYIPDPTLAIIGAVQAPPAFSFSDYTTLALAKVWTNKAKLPSIPTMRVLHAKTVEERGGYGKYVLFLGPARSPVVLAFLLGWLNESASKYGGKQINGLPKDLKEVLHYWEIAHFGGPLLVGSAGNNEAILTSLGVLRNRTGQGERDDYPLAVYDDDW